MQNMKKNVKRKHPSCLDQHNLTQYAVYITYISKAKQIRIQINHFTTIRVPIFITANFVHTFLVF